ncbi:MAG: DHH family phosphoesterase [Clostridiales Family XIII bacterium]|jgi:manganese-dependent inorganic pyrophosphatase|nr:DHH family phosphoesterase [Clostridiales Family XIII bacterium]
MGKDDLKTNGTYGDIHTKEESDAAYDALFRELHGVPDEDPRDGGEMKKVVVIGSTHPSTDSACSAIVYARLKDRVDSSASYKAYRAGPLNAETYYALHAFGNCALPYLRSIRNKNVILVDHNAKAEAAKGVEDATILEIIDHHALGGLETKTPVYFRSEPVGATSTIIFEMHKEWEVTPDRTDAGLLCSGILSATYMFRSPATTRADKFAAVELANRAGLDLEAYAEAMFRAYEIDGEDEARD